MNLVVRAVWRNNMSYIVLARKYRPQSFEEIYAQEHITQILANAIKANRIAHAFLFNGPRGVGKTSMARILAKSLNCAAGPTDHPCGVCSNCKEITNGTSNDVIEIDGASNTSVDDVRELQKELIYAPSQSMYKIYIIDEVHMLSKSAFNALLKTLEEPPENVIFIFATTEPHKVLPTIISRCQRFDFRRIPVEAITERLKEIATRENIEIDNESLYLIARKSDGGMRDALSLLDQILSYSNAKITIDLVQEVFGELPLRIYTNIMGAIVNHDPAKIIELYHEVSGRGIDLVEFLNSFLEFIRSLLLLKINIPPKGLVKEDLDALSVLIKQVPVNNLMYLMAMLIQLKQDIRTSTHPAILIEVTLIKMCRLDEMEELTALIDKISALPAGIQLRPAVSIPNPVSSSPQTSTTDSLPEEPITLEYTAPKKDLDFNLEFIEQNWNNILERVKKEKPILSIYLKSAKLIQYKNEILYLEVESVNQQKSIHDNQDFFIELIQKMYERTLRILVSVSATPQKVINRTPTLQDIEKTHPNLAKLIELTDAVISPG
jgi:DNA polymerase-3 subunit gamma/tau